MTQLGLCEPTGCLHILSLFPAAPYPFSIFPLASSSSWHTLPHCFHSCSDSLSLSLSHTHRRKLARSLFEHMLFCVTLAMSVALSVLVSVLVGVSPVSQCKRIYCRLHLIFPQPRLALKLNDCLQLRAHLTLLFVLAFLWWCPIVGSLSTLSVRA